MENEGIRQIIFTYNVPYNVMKKDVIDTRLNKFLNYGVKTCTHKTPLIHRSSKTIHY